jgi:tetratricopeptide (TPR) repeat protein
VSATLDRKLREAAAALAAGELKRAERLSREVLERAPRHPRALRLAAAARLRQEDGAGAGEFLRRALAGDPHNADLLEGLGAAALKAGKFAEAESWLRRAVTLGRSGAPTLTWLGLALSSQGRRADAVGIFRQAAAAAPEDPGLHLNLAHELAQIGEWQEAIATYERVLTLRPDDAGAHDSLGAALLESGKAAEAAECFRRALRLAPDHADYHADLGHALLEQELWDEAVASYERALALRPDYPEALNSLGSALLAAGDPERGMCTIRQAIALRPGYADGHANLGKVLLDQGSHDEAIPHFLRALEFDAANAEARFGLGTARLFRMEFGEGWRGWERRLEVRFRHKHFRSAPASAALYDRQPHWRGPAEEGVGTVAIWSEQGIGDQVLFSTLIPELVATGAPFLYEMDPRLLPAYQRAFPDVRFVERREPPQEALRRADRVLAAGSLPGLFRRSRGDFARQPAKLLGALPERVAHYRDRLGAPGPGLRVALSWKSTRKEWWLRSRKAVPLAELVPLLRLPGARFVDVQYGDTASERGALEAATGVRLARFDDVDYYIDLEAVLAILEACDLLITTSNATAHFAGALGKRTWLLYPGDRAPYYYWAHGGSYRCLWYPSVEIVTAPQLADWASLIEHTRGRLDRELKGPGPIPDGSSHPAGGR